MVYYGAWSEIKQQWLIVGFKGFHWTSYKSIATLFASKADIIILIQKNPELREFELTMQPI